MNLFPYLLPRYLLPEERTTGSEYAMQPRQGTRPLGGDMLLHLMAPVSIGKAGSRHIQSDGMSQPRPLRLREKKKRSGRSELDLDPRTWLTGGGPTGPRDEMQAGMLCLDPAVPLVVRYSTG